MGNFLTKPAKWRLFSKKEDDDDWATKSNWICKDQLCPNPYTHARGDPCKLMMEDLFPSRPEPPTSENTKQPSSFTSTLATKKGNTTAITLQREKSKRKISRNKIVKQKY